MTDEVKPDAYQDLRDRLVTMETALGRAVAEISQRLQQLEDRLEALASDVKREEAGGDRDRRRR